jgi:hypothetical protein
VRVERPRLLEHEAMQACRRPVCGREDVGRSDCEPKIDGPTFVVEEAGLKAGGKDALQQRGPREAGRIRPSEGNRTREVLWVGVRRMALERRDSTQSVVIVAFCL